MELSFTEEFFSGDGEVDMYSIEPSERPTSVLQAIVSLDRETQEGIARDILGAEDPKMYVNCESFPFDVLERVKEVNACDGLESPVRVYLDDEQCYYVDVYE